MNFSVPAPKAVAKPMLFAFVTARQIWYTIYRVFVCEPLFKAYCHSYGRNLHTGVFVHWVQGKGNIILGDNVLIDGKCNFAFAVRYSVNPTFRMGNNSGLGHGCIFTIGKEISIGNDCRLAPFVTIFDSPGHPLDPVLRRAGAPANTDDVRPVTLGDNVWIGSGAVIFPGVTIGENSVVSSGAYVMSDVPANTVVAGNPARKVMSLQPKEQAPVTA
jgi:acetyltransferase-like isoleucine patch superfamily enzyme